MDMKAIENFLINECGYKSIEDAIENTPKINFYAFVGKVENEEDKLYE